MAKSWRGKNNPHYRGGGVSLVCPICHKQFKAWPSEIRRGRKYCSSRCYGKIHPNRTRNWEEMRQILRDLYVDNKLNTIQLAKKFNCDPKTITYWMEKFGIHRRTSSEIHKLFNPTKNADVREKMRLAARKRWARPEEREKNRLAHLGRSLSDEHKLRISMSLKGNQRRKGIPHSKEDKTKIGQVLKEMWKNPEYAKKVITALQIEPNKFEMKLIELIKRNAFPFKYVGNGQAVIDGQVPDFIATNGSKNVIELFGTPWHDPNHSEKIKVKPSRTEEAKISFYKSHGYDCLVIWDHELKSKDRIVDKINMFLEKHSELS